jgi:uncharacterized membrane-anchored protein
MKWKTLLPLLFILLVIFQLYVPASAVFNQERIHFSGTKFKMQLAPIDPNDPFRGKYIILSFKENRARLPKQGKYDAGDIVYVIMKPGKDEFLKIESISHEYESMKSPKVCIKARIHLITESDGYKDVQLVYPFTRFYVEESKAAEIEDRYLKALSDTNTVSYGLISIYKETAAVSDVIINGESLMAEAAKK